QLDPDVQDVGEPAREVIREGDQSAKRSLLSRCALKLPWPVPWVQHTPLKAFCTIVVPQRTRHRNRARQVPCRSMYYWRPDDRPHGSLRWPAVLQSGGRERPARLDGAAPVAHAAPPLAIADSGRAAAAADGRP